MTEDFRFEGIESALESLIFLSRGGGQIFDRVKLFSAHEIETAHRFPYALLRCITCFARHAGKSACSAVHQFDEIGDEWVFTLHGFKMVRLAPRRKC